MQIPKQPRAILRRHRSRWSKMVRPANQEDDIEPYNTDDAAFDGYEEHDPESDAAELPDPGCT